MRRVMLRTDRGSATAGVLGLIVVAALFIAVVAAVLQARANEWRDFCTTSEHGTVTTGSPSQCVDPSGNVLDTHP